LTLAACSGKSDFTQLQTKKLDLSFLHFFDNYVYSYKYLEERLTNAGTRANPPFLTYALSNSGL